MRHIPCKLLLAFAAFLLSTALSAPDGELHLRIESADDEPSNDADLPQFFFEKAKAPSRFLLAGGIAMRDLQNCGRWGIMPLGFGLLATL
jgi:hypothetical protein